MNKGIYIGKNDKNNYQRYNKDTHILTVAQSGGGKNASLIMPNLLMENFEGSKIILDLKGENSAVCSYWKACENKGKVYRLNPWNIFEMPSITYNPFCSLNPFEDDFYDDCIAFADVIIPHKENQSDTGEHFDDLAREFISSFLLYLSLKNYPKAPTPATLYEEVIRSTSSIVDLNFVAEDMQSIPHPDSDIKRALELSAITVKSLTSTGDNNELRGVKTTLSRALNSFKSKRLLNSVNSNKEESQILLKELFHRNGSNDLYICFPQSEIRQSVVWLRLVLTSFIREIIKNPPCKPILFVLDEFPQLGNFSLIKNSASFLRGYHVRFWFILQNLEQLTFNYGKSGKQEIVENCGVSLFFNVKDETAKYVSEKLDKYSRLIENHETNEYKTNYERLRKTRSEVEQELLTITFIDQIPPVLLKRIPYYEMDKIKDRALPNPLFHGVEAFKEERIKLLGN